MQAILKRLKEPSTWAGVSMLAVMFGVPASTADAVVNAIGALAAVGAILLPEKASA